MRTGSVIGGLGSVAQCANWRMSGDIHSPIPYTILLGLAYLSALARQVFGCMRASGRLVE
jgi:hypothetical protein